MTDATPDAATGENPPVLEPIRGVHARAVAEYLASTFAGLRTADEWYRTMTPPWAADAPDLGFMLTVDGDVRGAVLMSRATGRDGQSVCHLGAWHVDPDLRIHSIRLLRASLREDVELFTDFTPSATVQRLNRRLGFVDVETPAFRVFSLRIPLRRARLSRDPDRIAAALSGYDLDAFRAHRTIDGLGHLLLETKAGTCWVVYRERFARVTSAEIIHVSDRAVFRRAAARVFLHLLLRRRAAFVRVDERVIGYRPALAGFIETSVRQLRVKAGALPDFDYLYSPIVWRI